MNSMVIDSVRGLNRLDAFLNSQPAGRLHQVNPAELQAVEGGILPVIAGFYFLGLVMGVAVGAVLAKALL
jgi:hypothetical protein